MASSSKKPTSSGVNEIAYNANDRCMYVNHATGARCHNKLGIYPHFCKRHTNVVENLQIEKSLIPKSGNGLFAGSKGFKKGEPIARYGYAWNFVKYGDIKGSYEYVFCHGNKCWDGIDPKSTIARYSNDCHNSKTKDGRRIQCNAYFKMINKIPYIVASKDIPPHAEVYTTYGDEYWTGH